VGGPKKAYGLSLSAPAPNPSRGVALLRFTVPVETDAALEILDVSGRRVRTIDLGVLVAGEYARTWDGLSAGGTEVPAGIYFARLRTTVGTRVTRLVRLH